MQNHYSMRDARCPPAFRKQRPTGISPIRCQMFFIFEPYLPILPYPEIDQVEFRDPSRILQNGVQNRYQEASWSGLGGVQEASWKGLGASIASLEAFLVLGES